MLYCCQIGNEQAYRVKVRINPTQTHYCIKFTDLLKLKIQSLSAERDRCYMMGCRISRDTDVKVKSEEKLRDELL